MLFILPTLECSSIWKWLSYTVISCSTDWANSSHLVHFKGRFTRLIPFNYLIPFNITDFIKQVIIHYQGCLDSRICKFHIYDLSYCYECLIPPLTFNLSCVGGKCNFKSKVVQDLFFFNNAFWGFLNTWGEICLGHLQDNDI